MIISSAIVGHIKGRVTWGEVAALAIAFVVLYYCKRRLSW